MSNNWDQVDKQNVQFTARSIGSFTATCTIEEVGLSQLTITEHPVQEGAAITDHAFVQPITLSCRVYFDNSKDDLKTIYQNLLNLQSSRELFTVVTGKRTYKNMLFRSLRQNTNPDTENCLSIDADFQQIIIVSIQTASLPSATKQAFPQQTQATQDAGEKNAQPVTVSSSVSDRINAIANQPGNR